MITIIYNWLATQMPSIVSDLWSIQLSLIGIAVSVMTLLFASHVDKVETYRHISKSKEINNVFLGISLSNGIKAFELLNRKIVVALFGACVLFGYSCVVKYINNVDVLMWMGGVDLLLTLGLITWTFRVVMSVVKKYKDEVK